MKTTLIDLFTSKKFLAALAAIIVYIAGRFGFAVDPATLDRVFAALLVYVGAQGVADVGRGAAQAHIADFNRRMALLPKGGLIDASPGIALAKTPEAGRVGLTVVTLLATIGLFCWACASVGPAVSTGTVAALDCEAPDIARAFADLLPIAESAVERWIGDGGKIDPAGLKADMAQIKSDLGRCLEAGAIAAIGTTRRASAQRNALVDGTQALAAFATARGELGWAPVRLPGGQVL